MGLDDGAFDGCPHESVTTRIEPAKSGGGVGFGFVDECAACGAAWYEPSNLDKFPETGGLDPRLYPGQYERTYGLAALATVEQIAAVDIAISQRKLRGHRLQVVVQVQIGHAAS